MQLHSCYNVKCSRCRRREAKVYRRLTQQRLCVECYADYLYKQVKKNIATLKLKEPRVPITVPFHPMFPRESILLAIITAEIEKRYGNVLKVLVTREGEDSTIVRYLKSKGNVVIEKIDLTKVPGRVQAFLEKPSPLNGAGLVTSWRLYRGVFARALDKGSKSILVLPSCMDFLVLLELSSLLQGKLEGLGEVVESFEHPTAKVLIVNGFYGVPCAETTLASYLLVDLKYTKQFDPRSTVDRYALYMLEDAVRDRSYEILFSTYKILDPIRERALERCEFCGGLASSDMCYWCLRVLR